MYHCDSYTVRWLVLEDDPEYEDMHENIESLQCSCADVSNRIEVAPETQYHFIENIPEEEKTNPDTDKSKSYEPDHLLKSDTTTTTPRITTQQRTWTTTTESVMIKQMKCRGEWDSFSNR